MNLVNLRTHEVHSSIPIVRGGNRDERGAVSDELGLYPGSLTPGLSVTD